MQEDEFEKNIQNKLKEFLIVPDDEVWQKVSVRIAKEKKRRAIFVFWISLVFLLIAGTSALLVTNHFSTKETHQDKMSFNQIKKVDPSYKPTVEDRRVVIKKIVAAKEKPVTFHQKKVESIYQKASVTKTSLVKTDAAKTDVTKTSHQTKKIQLQEFEAINKITGKKAETDISENTNLREEKQFFPHKFYNPNLVAKTAEELNTKTPAGQLNFEKDTSDKTLAKEMMQSREAEKKWQFGLTLYAGVANNFSTQMKFGTSSGYNTSAGTINNNLSDSSNKFRVGFSFGLGVFVKKQFTERVSLSTGIDFHSYNVQLKVGNKVAGNPDAYTAVRDDPYYAAGSSTNYINKYRLIELPVNIGYRINRNQQKPVLVSAGISPGYLVSTNALFGNSVARVYYEDKGKFHHLQFSTQAGLLLPVSSAKKYLLSAGPYVQYGVSNAAKASSGTSQHLFFTGIKATITFK